MIRRYDALSDVVKDVMFADASADKITAIGKEHGLLIDQVGALASEIGYFMLGMTPPQDFKKRLMAHVGVESTVAEEIIKELNESIFIPIRKHLAEIHPEDEMVDTAPPPPPPQPTPPPPPPRPSFVPVQQQKPQSSADLFIPKPSVLSPGQAPRPPIPPAPPYIASGSEGSQSDPYHEPAD